jgi:succinate dehydrogenase / fumarate reductase flavoprotein subunit
MDRFESHTYDVLVIGAGGAGLRAAIEAGSQGASVGLICKSLLGKAHTVMAEGGIAAALANTDPRDGWKVHFRDTMRGGKLLNNWRMAQLLAQEAPQRVLELEAWGALFDRTSDGRILQRNFGGHQYPRLAHVGDRTGLEMIRTLQDRTVQLANVDVHMECTVVHLFKDEAGICGAFAYRRDSGRFIVFRTKAVVLATGGIGRAYRINSNSWEYTGDGHVLAYNAGADLIDMEFVQFHPTGMVWPLSVRGILVTEGVRGEGGVLKNSKGERFMFRYIPEMFRKDVAANEEEANSWVDDVINGRTPTARRPPELLTRDVVARAITSEVREGRGSPHGGAFLDIASRRKAEDIRRKLPSMYQQFHELADVDGGLHGSNRLGGNSLSDLLVFGRRAGAGAATHARQRQGEPQLNDADVEAVAAQVLAPLERTGGENPYAVQDALQEMMGTLVGIARSEDDLNGALEAIAKLKARAEAATAHGDRRYNPGWHTALDLRHLLTVSEAVTRAALERRESRGAHTRVECPDSDSKFGSVNVIIRRDGDKMIAVQEPRRELPDDLRGVLEGEA